MNYECVSLKLVLEPSHEGEDNAVTGVALIGRGKKDVAFLPWLRFLWNKVFLICPHPALPEEKKRTLFWNGPDPGAFAGNCDMKAQVPELPKPPVSPGDCKLRLAWH